MTPKEKAENLVQRFIYRRTDYVEVDDAKQCALIAVDEIINANPYKWIPFMGKYSETVLISNKSYWLEVKKEIEKKESNEQSMA